MKDIKHLKGDTDEPETVCATEMTGLVQNVDFTAEESYQNICDLPMPAKPPKKYKKKK